MRHRPGLTRWCEHALPHGGLADDVVQETFLVAHGALRDGEHPEHLRAWLYGIARHRTATARRRAHETVALSPELDGVERPEEIAERRRRLRAAVAGVRRLPAPQRLALVGRALDGRAYPEIAARLGVSEPAARQLVARARHTLREVTAA